MRKEKGVEDGRTGSRAVLEKRRHLGLIETRRVGEGWERVGVGIESVV